MRNTSAFVLIIARTGGAESCCGLWDFHRSLPDSDCPRWPYPLCYERSGGSGRTVAGEREMIK